MGDARFKPYYQRIRDAADPAAVMRGFADEAVVWALAAASDESDPYLANVLATEAVNRIERLSAVTASLGEGVVAADARGVITFENPAAGRLLGHAPGTLGGRLVAGALGPEVDRLRAAAGHGSREGTRAALALRRADGSTFPAVCTIAPLEREGRSMGAVLVFLDVTAERAAEEERERIRSELAAERARLEAVLRQAPVGVVIRDAGGRLLLVNEAMRRIWRRDERPEAMAFPAARPDGTPFAPHEWPLARAIASGEIVAAEDVRAMRGDGTSGWVRVNASPIRDAHGRIVAGVLVADDVTPEREAEAARLEAEERYRKFVEQSPEPTAVHSGGRIVYVNPAGARLMGARDPADLVGRSVLDLVHPQSRPLVVERLKVLARGEAPPIVTEKLLRVDGETIEAEVSAMPLFYRGEPAVQIVLRDLTARRRAEERFRTLFEQSPLAKQIFAPDGRALAANRAWEDMWQARREDLEGYNVLDDPQLERKGVTPLLRRAFEGERVEIPPVLYDPAETEKPGRPRWVKSLAYPLKDAGDVVREVVLVLEDVTARVAAEDAVRRLNQELERRVDERTRELASANAELASFSYSVSHDLRSPLRGLDYLSRALLEDYADKLDDAGREQLRRIRGEADRLTHLIHALLELSRFTALDLRRESVDVTALARGVGSDLRAREPDRAVAFTVEDGLRADADPRLLNVVLENLLGNAWKFTSRTPEARVDLGSAVVPGGARAFYVRDNGAGFDPSKADRLFGAFQRLHSASEFEGTGIGLATVQRIVRRHGGRVWAEGEPDKGATFWFTLG